MMKNTVKTVLVLVTAAGLISACGEKEPVLSDEEVEVEITSMEFLPGNISIGKGYTVIWTNTSEDTHTVTSGEPGDPKGLFESGPLAAEESFQFTFDSLGSYLYYSEYDPTMTGIVIVAEDTTMTTRTDPVEQK